MSEGELLIATWLLWFLGLHMTKEGTCLINF